jgi:integrase
VRVYGGVDPLTKKPIYLRETIPPGSKSKTQAEKALTRLLGQVDEKRNPRTRATVSQLLDKWIDVHDVDDQTRRGYESKIRKHIRPLIGGVSLAKLEVETLDSFYAELRRCRDHCDGKPRLQHRTPGRHQCDEHRGEPCAPPDPSNCRACQRACKTHVCKGLADSTIRQIHWILSGALDRAVIWKWISVNPAAHASKPPLPRPDPQPPTSDEAGRLAMAAWDRDPHWGALVWTKMTTGMRRGEICALRWSHISLEKAVVSVRRAVYADPVLGVLVEKDTKTHQQRRIVLDPETVAVLADHRQRAEQHAEAGGYEFSADGFVFSPTPDGRTPIHPDTVTQRYRRMARRLKIDTTIKNLRHYSATELISSGVNIRTVAGRLGHGGGGATTLRVYTAWSAESDQRAAATLRGQMPERPAAADQPNIRTVAKQGPGEPEGSDHPYQRIASDLRASITCGALRPGQPLPSEKELAHRYEVAISTAHRAVALLVAEGLVRVARGRRAMVAGDDGAVDAVVIPLQSS